MTVEMAYAWAMSIMHIMIVCGVRWAHSMAESEKYHNWHNDWLLIYDLITPQRNDMNIWDEWIENAFAPGVWVREREREREIANVPSEMATSCRERAPANWWYAFFLPRGCTVSAYSLYFVVVVCLWRYTQIVYHLWLFRFFIFGIVVATLIRRMRFDKRCVMHGNDCSNAQMAMITFVCNAKKRFLAVAGDVEMHEENFTANFCIRHSIMSTW